MEDENKAKVSFKKVKAKNFRRREEGERNEDDNGEEEIWQKLDVLKEAQCLKRRVAKGLRFEAKNDVCPLNEEKKIGGLIDMKNSELDLGNTFSVETNRRDEDQDMIKFIEEELAKRKGLLNSSNSYKDNQTKLPEDVFDILPQHLLQSSSKRKNEEMLSNQMLNGIPEVDLGIEERIRNIEATEEAKVSLLQKPKTKTNSTSTLVPTNIAANYAQNNRFNINEDNTLSFNPNKKPKINKPAVNIVQEPVVVIGDEPRQGRFKTQSASNNKLKFPGKEKATDDYCYEKFKKQFKK
ncbi:hypothetical protein B4U79_10822 [Dinothrombium tinctorium]|uniref:Telomere length and silencing protein 1 homolog n=1 Tax=Dinothrombium tinctorium TaxID=1965070 RepID=A0A3S3R1V9_9ACAR|nr:hypothetical protein B4U79_10822 [Dinothrombium tinctorium]